LDGDLRARDDLAPDADLALEVPRHLLRRGGRGDGGLLKQHLSQPRLIAGADDLAVQPLDERSRCSPLWAEAVEETDGTIERLCLDTHQVTFRLSNSRLIFEVCDSPVCGSSSRTPTGETIVRRPTTSLSRRSKSSFTAAPCAADRLFRSYALREKDHAFALATRLHWAALIIAALAISAGVLGAHGYLS
jgi:hypothetical protein